MSRNKAPSRTTEVVPEEEEDIDEGFTPYSPFFSIRFGDDNEAVFNIDCLNKHLIRLIRKKCKLDRKGTYDLIKTNGELMNYWKKSSKEYASQTLQPRTTYVIVQAEVNDSTNNHSNTKWRPLLESLTAYPELEAMFQEVDDQFETSPVQSANSKKRDLRKKSERSDRRSSRVGGADDKVSTRRPRGSITPASKNGKS